MGLFCKKAFSLGNRLRRLYLSFFLFVSSVLLICPRRGDAADFVCNDDTDCLPNGACDGESLVCFCDSGYYGQKCEEDCPLQCENGGQCRLTNDHGGLIVAGDYFYCECDSAFTGGLCQVPTFSGRNGLEPGIVLGIVLCSIVLTSSFTCIAIKWCKGGTKTHGKECPIEHASDEQEIPPVA